MNSIVEWQHPQAFFLILPLCAIWIGLALFARARRRQAAAKFVAPAMMPRILPRESSGRFWTKTILVGLGFIFGILALARPRFGVYYEDIRARGSDIYVAIDVSRSMLADDVPPSRLARAKADVQTLLNRLHGERVGLIAFAGVAVVKCPLTTDYNFFRLALHELSPNSVPRGGTAIGDAIRKALEVMPKLGDRDQALLLITDGDDQNSYPLDAASTAAERAVTIFTVGLGDPNSGSRVPLESGGNLMYEGAPVISKMGAQLLKDIAIKTNGACVAAGTKDYDLGELYVDRLSKLHGAEGSERKRMRLAEQYQWFLALALLCLLADLFIRMYEPRAAFKTVKRAQAKVIETPPTKAKPEGEAPVKAQPQETAPPPTPPFQGGEVIARLVLIMVALPIFSLHAGEERELVKQGLELYKKDDFDGAREKFNKAAEDDAKEQERENAALIAFDLACAYHRKGDAEHAREQYLRAGLSRDKKVAAAADFNLGCMASETARTLAGEQPETVPPEKRQEILDKLKEAVGSFRSSLEVLPDHALARKNIELIRMWIKTYTDRWREMDKQKLREKSNLFEFLQYIIASERMLRASVLELKDNSTLDVLFEHHQAQKELRDEIEPLKDKIAVALKPLPQAPATGAQPAPAGPNEKELAEGIKLLNGWADAAGAKMRSAETQLDSRQPKKAAADQKDAITELERIWEALIPFRPLLAHDLGCETAIVHELKPELPADDKSESSIGTAFDWVKDIVKSKLETPKPPATAPNATPPTAPAPKLELDSAMSDELAELQEMTSHRTDLLKAKAQAELEQVEKMPPQAQPKPPDPADPKAEKPPDPEKVKAGLRKAIELAPKAVEHMNAAARQLRKGDRVAATPEAEEAKKILEEIMKAQPQDEQKKQDQDKKDQQKKDQEKKDQDKKDQDKKDEKKDDKKDQEKKDQEKKDQDKKDEGKNGEKKKQPMSKEQAEALLRKVREREQKHRKEREEQALIMGGNAPVEKDW